MLCKKKYNENENPAIPAPKSLQLFLFCSLFYFSCISFQISPPGFLLSVALILMGTLQIYTMFQKARRLSENETGLLV